MMRILLLSQIYVGYSYFNIISPKASYNLLSDKVGLDDYLEKIKRPSPVDVPRKRIELPFAVQLMRTSYNIVDELDFVPMDDFQKSFFLFRQNEWEDYRQNHPNIMQGDLADSSYFDFISFSQYAVISDKCKTGQLQFVEKIGADGDTQIVRRNAMYENNELLPLLHSTKVGNTLLDFILDKYPIITPRNITQDESFTSFLEDAQLILDIFLINSYALEGNIIPLTSSRNIVTTPAVEETQIPIKLMLRYPANLWSQQVLRSRKDTPINDFEIKVLAALARRHGLSLSIVSYNVLNRIDVSYVLKLSKGVSLLGNI